MNQLMRDHRPTTFVVHDNPARRADANYVARIDLERFGFEGEVEQVWLRRLDGDLAELCCIPFVAYGLALNDVVRISPDGSHATDLVTASGHRALRILIAPEHAPGPLEAVLAASGLAHEWRGGRHVAIDVPPEAQPAELGEFVVGAAAAGHLHWEWSQVEAFHPEQ